MLTINIMITNSTFLILYLDWIQYSFISSDDPLWIYRVSFMWYGWIALFVAILVAVPVSLITGPVKAGTDYDRNLIFSCGQNREQDDEIKVSETA